MAQYLRAYYQATQDGPGGRSDQRREEKLIRTSEDLRAIYKAREKRARKQYNKNWDKANTRHTVEPKRIIKP